jgi:hypothetical protein
MIKFLKLLCVAVIALPACTTATYVAGPDPIPVIGAQLIGTEGGCADVQDGGTADGTPVNLFHCHGSTNQRWPAVPMHAPLLVVTRPRPPNTPRVYAQCDVDLFVQGFATDDGQQERT